MELGDTGAAWYWRGGGEGSQIEANHLPVAEKAMERWASGERRAHFKGHKKPTTGSDDTQHVRGRHKGELEWRTGRPLEEVSGHFTVAQRDRRKK